MIYCVLNTDIHTVFNFSYTTGNREHLFMCPSGVAPPGCDTGWCHAPGHPASTATVTPDHAWHGLGAVHGCWYKCNVTARSFQMASVRCRLQHTLIGLCYSVTALFTCQDTGNADPFGSLLSIDLDRVCGSEMPLAVKLSELLNPAMRAALWFHVITLIQSH